MLARQTEPHSGNMSDAALLEGAAVKLRRIALEMQAEAKGGETRYAEEAFEEAFALIDDAVSALTGAAIKATENAMDDAAGEAADRAYDESKED